MNRRGALNPPFLFCHSVCPHEKEQKTNVFCSFSIIPIMRPIPELARHLHSLAPVRITVSVLERMRHWCIPVADKRHSAVFLHAFHLHSLNCLLHIMQKSGDAELVLPRLNLVLLPSVMCQQFPSINHHDLLLYFFSRFKLALAVQVKIF